MDLKAAAKELNGHTKEEAEEYELSRGLSKMALGEGFEQEGIISSDSDFKRDEK